jgi:hypothetical protein
LLLLQLLRQFVQRISKRNAAGRQNISNSYYNTRRYGSLQLAAAAKLQQETIVRHWAAI